MFDTLKSNLEARGYKVSCFDTADDAVDYLNGEIDGATVGIGGSMTVEEMGLYDALMSHNRVYWHQKSYGDKTPAEVIREANAADIYISSVNGIAESGEIVNIDGRCNRVSSALYGHKKVYFVVGENKIAPDYDGALFRARNVAAPLNAKRLGKKTPCAVRGDKCYDCKSPDRICRSLVVLWEKPTSCEYEVVIIGEKLGY